MSKAAPKHRAKREIKRTLKPGARGLVGSRGKALSEFEAEPHSAQADKVQIVVSKAYRNMISDESDIGELNLHRLSSPKRNVDTQRAERFCGGRTCPNNCRGEQRSPVFRICYNFRIVGAWRNFCFAEIRRPDPLARLCTSA